MELTSSFSVAHCGLNSKSKSSPEVVLGKKHDQDLVSASQMQCCEPQHGRGSSWEESVWNPGFMLTSERGASEHVGQPPDAGWQVAALN